MEKSRILVVDDEKDIRELLEYNLAREGYDVDCVATGEAALDAARSKKPDLVILDLMLPGIDGLEVCRTLKAAAATGSVPIVMLTAKGEEADVVTGLELGADDYVTKPFSPRVLMSRVKAVLRRRAASAAVDDKATLCVDDLTIDPGRHEVMADGKPVSLTYTEFRILHFLARRPGWVFTRYQIVDGAQGEDVAVTDRSVDVHIVSLRRKLGPCGTLIETVRGVGYRFKDS
jgi:two-component system, OmpR family, alkaline phosphatase synthesis response regulator PhoP